MAARTGVVTLGLIWQSIPMDVADTMYFLMSEILYFPLHLALFLSLTATVCLTVWAVFLFVRGRRTNVGVRRGAWIAIALLLPVLVGMSLVIDFAIDSKYPKTGFINLQGEWVIEPRYRYATSFSAGYASVTFKGEWVGEAPAEKRSKMAPDLVTFVSALEEAPRKHIAAESACPRSAPMAPRSPRPATLP